MAYSTAILAKYATRLRNQAAECLLKLSPKQQCRKGHRQKICHRLCRINRKGLVASQHTRQDINERDQQDKFPGHRHNNGLFRKADGGKCHLAGDLNAKHKDTGHINAERPGSEGQKLCVRGKHSRKSLRNHLYKQPDQGGILPRLLEKRNMKIGFYKVSAKLNNVLIEQRFFYFLQKTIWIDFDCANSNSLLISKYYRQIPL